MPRPGTLERPGVDQVAFASLISATSLSSLEHELAPAMLVLPEVSGLPFFAGDELARALDQDEDTRFHPFQNLALIDAEPLRGPPDTAPGLCLGLNVFSGEPLPGIESCGLETRIGVSRLLPGDRVGREGRVTLGLHWACGLSGCEVASEQRKDPLGLAASVSKSGVIVGVRPDGSRYRIEPGTDPVVALRILESDADISTPTQQEDILARAQMAIPYSSAGRPGEELIGSRQPNPRAFTHLPSGGSWFEAALVATTGLPAQTREQEIVSNAVRAAVVMAPAPLVVAARAKGGVGRPIQPAELPTFSDAPAPRFDSRGPHRASMTVLDKDGNLIHSEELVSGGSGKAKPTWPEQGAVHTEGKGTNAVRGLLEEGEDVGSVEFFGQLPSCPMCKGNMNKLHREVGVPSTYVDSDGNPWTSTPKRRRGTRRPSVQQP